MPVGVVIELLAMLWGRLFVLSEGICGRLRIPFLFYELFFALTAQIITSLLNTKPSSSCKKVLLAYLKVG